ncbi:xanthine dehydrogenase family protein [Dactylosporangium aurantiacum]|uniref:Xanthine dehydrogenase family protein n=1 Tax=Dactylosporangium aurantiacum TaxID=35754 RepID=A0A9Q9IKN3_9ACTN|nr:xanthine dehydrogenase family protein molybdopterin-binding subunit [Dactylosporangium aurantiacum]MDG6105909.1 xanthine dehydrogenase family protein molybdopterin-binding subunit [Dactylosporangium aurantiacum]UWZ57917.1 xanthine dehydrogenase family protein [Dactylosporangium aurantiacum]
MVIGARLPRREDERLVRGAGRFVADLRVPHCLEAAFVRGDTAHGRLRDVRLDRVRSVPGVVAAFAAADLAADLAAVPVTPPMMDPRSARDRPWPALATDRVRHVGQPVAVVLAADRYVAEDGRDAAEVDIEPLPVLLDPAEAADGVPLFEGLSNVAGVTEFGAPVDEAVWRDAAVVVEGTYRQQLLAHTSLEPRAVLVRPDGGDRFTVWCSHQAPHRLRRDLAAAFGLAEEQVRVIVPDVGGAFGGKSETYPEYLAVFAAARRLDRPVRWLEDRAEALAGPPHGRGQHQRTRMAATADGRILAYELLVDADIGGYPHTGAFVPWATSMMANGAYVIPHLYVRARAVLTTTAPTAPYRGAGRPEAASAIERTVDLLAHRLGLDPAELRRRNLIPPDAFPYPTVTGYTYDSGDYATALDVALRAVGYDGWRAEQARRRGTGGTPLGIGLCTYVERSGAGGEFGAVEACPDGTFVAVSGCCSTGQGHETSFPQVVASVLGVAPRRVRLVERDTALVPEGIGSYASRSMQTGGAALQRAAGKLVDEARRRAGELWGLPVTAVEHHAGTLSCGGHRLSMQELVAATGALRAEETSAPPEAFPFGAYAAVVEVEPELGEVRVLRLVAVDDYGVVVNPLIVDGQGRGSAVQGLGQALFEELRYDAEGRPEQRGLLDYLLPTVSELPPMTFEETCTPNPNTPLGAKGAGEAGCIGVPPALVNAVADALQLDDRDALQMPLTPYTCWSAARVAVR